MLTLRPMTRFATHLGMRSGLLEVGHFGVAGFTGFPAGEERRAVGDVLEGVGAVVAELAEAFGDNQAARDDEDEESDDEYQGDADEMPGVLESIAH